ncbi:flagellar filament capping protein FliD, partial [Desulfuribacillus alkaliarsenatis]|uniref:flagellar filament capping protein FliD n=1 Tax=Desulfuribacillus alkaliarsenatis TaxID=766136 RepID=UPI000A81A88D
MVGPIRFGGLASGMDTETMIKDLMRAERMPMDRMFQRKQWTEWQRDAFREVNSKMLEFRNIAGDMRLQGTFLARKVTSTDSNAVTARAVGAGANFTSQIRVNQVAEAAYINSAEAVSINHTSAEDMQEHVGKKFTINGTEFTVRDNETLNQLISRINNSKAGVSMFYDTQTNKVSMSSRETGLDGLDLVDDSDFLHEVLNLYEVNNGDEPVNYSNGKNAKFVLNGLETERKANVFTISGVEYTIKAVTDNAVTVSSVSDTDAIFDKIKGFV